MKVTQSEFVGANIPGIAKGEPIFILRGSDPHAAVAMRRYAESLAAAHGDAGALSGARESAVQIERFRAQVEAEEAEKAKAEAAAALPVAEPGDAETAAALAAAGVQVGDVIDIPGEGEHVVGELPVEESAAPRPRKKS